MSTPVESTQVCPDCKPTQFLNYFIEEGKNNNGLYECPKCHRKWYREDYPYGIKAESPESPEMIETVEAAKEIIKKEEAKKEPKSHKKTKEETKMSSRGTCRECGRPDMSIVTDNLCGKCYKASKTDKVIKDVVDVQPKKKMGRPKKVKVVKEPKVIPTSEIVKPIVAEGVTTITVPIPGLDKYSIAFDVEIKNVRII